jgi:hypothetical protein
MIRLLILFYFVSSTCLGQTASTTRKMTPRPSQSSIAVYINQVPAAGGAGKLSVLPTDSIQIKINSANAARMFQKIEATVCSQAGNNAEKRQANDRTELLFSNGAGASAKARVTTSPGQVTVAFKVGQVSLCPYRYFWVNLTPNASAQAELRSIPGFISQYTFIRIK